MAERRRANYLRDVADDVLEDLRSEQLALDALLSPQAEDAWDLPTPAGGWRVRDQLGHLTFYEEQALVAVREPATFRASVADALEHPTKHAALAGAVGRDLTGAALLGRWRAACRAAMDAITPLPRDARLPWYGPPMSVRSFATARLMETWAHGTDVADALTAAGRPSSRPATDRLRHICHLGSITRGWSYQVRGLEPPDAPVRIELTLPSGAPWSEGPETADDVVAGPAVDFCLVVTQRRHVDATGLAVRGRHARDWMEIAQCFAGEPTLARAATS